VSYRYEQTAGTDGCAAGVGVGDAEGQRAGGEGKLQLPCVAPESVSVWPSVPPPPLLMVSVEVPEVDDPSVIVPPVPVGTATERGIEVVEIKSAARIDDEIRPASQRMVGSEVELPSCNVPPS